jgi:hypothetical protein
VADDDPLRAKVDVRVRQGEGFVEAQARHAEDEDEDRLSLVLHWICEQPLVLLGSKPANSAAGRMTGASSASAGFRNGVPSGSTSRSNFSSQA